MYEEVSIYRRTSALVDHGNGKNYAVDFFRVEGGDTQDYVFHLSGLNYEINGLALEESTDVQLYDFTNIQRSSGSEVWNIQWRANSGILCRVWGLGAEDEEVLVADGWGQRDWKNSDVGAEIPYVVRRYRGDGLKTFISVVEGYGDGHSFVRSVRMLEQGGIIAVETEDGVDYIASSFGDGKGDLSYGSGNRAMRGRFAVVSVADDQLKWRFEVKDG